MKKDVAQKILNETEVGYDLIAEKFSQTRKHFWRGLESISDYTRENDNVLDFGCGNGRLLELLKGKDIQYWGVDTSAKLIEFAKDKYQVAEFDSESESNSGTVNFSKINPNQTSLPQASTNFKTTANDNKAVIGNIKSEKDTRLAGGLAFKEGFFNTIYSIAVFHHFPSQQYRQEIANELYRVTKSGGYVVVTVWYLWPSFSASWRIRRGKQKKYFKNILQNWKNKIFGMIIRMSAFRSAGSGRDSGVNNLDWNDCEISFTDNQGRKFQRFHHAFTRRELQKLFESVGFKTEKCVVVDGRNILFIGEK